MEDVRRVGEEVGAEVLPLTGVRQLRDVLGQLPAGVLPREVGVGLAEADLAEVAHHRAAGERLGEEHDLPVAGVDLGDQPRPERKRLRVRVVDAEHLHPALDPPEHHAEQRVPQALPVLGVPVEVVDVLVALGRVLGVLQGPVRPAVEPLRVLGEPRVVGRGLDREIERDVDAVLPRGGGERAQVRLRAELGMDRVVAAGGVPDRPRRAWIVGRRGERVVAALAVRQPDRVDRRQVDDVEAEFGERWELLRHPGEAAPRAREHLVPGAEPGAEAVDIDRQRGLELGRAEALRRAFDGSVELLAEDRVVLDARRRRFAAQRRERVPDERLLLVARGTFGGCREQHLALRELAREIVLAGLDLAPQLVAPGPEHVGPGDDRPFPAADPLDQEAPRPADAVEVGVGLVQLALLPLRVARAAEAHGSPQQLVAVAEDVGADVDRVADAPLHGVAAAVHDGSRQRDHDPPRRRGRRGVRGGLAGAGAGGRGRRTHSPRQYPEAPVG